MDSNYRIIELSKTIADFMALVVGNISYFPLIADVSDFSQRYVLFAFLTSMLYICACVAQWIGRLTPNVLIVGSIH